MNRLPKALAAVAGPGLLAVLVVVGTLSPDAGAKPSTTTEAPASTIVPTTVPCDPAECPVPCEPPGYDDCAPPTTVRPPNCFDVYPLGPGCIPVPDPDGPGIDVPLCIVAGGPVVVTVDEETCAEVPAPPPVSASPETAG